MVVEVRLLGGLDRSVPGATFLEPFRWQLSPKATVNQLLSQLGLQDKMVIAVVNGSRQELDFCLAEGDRVALFPPVGGG